MVDSPSPPSPSSRQAPSSSAWVVGSRQNAWRNPLEGAAFTRLTDFESAETDAVISPDGNFVAFISDRDGPLDVWLLQLGSGQFLNLTHGKFPALWSSQDPSAGILRRRLARHDDDRR